MHKDSNTRVEFKLRYHSMEFTENSIVFRKEFHK